MPTQPVRHLPHHKARIHLGGAFPIADEKCDPPANPAVLNLCRGSKLVPRFAQRAPHDRHKSRETSAAKRSGMT